MLKDYVLDDLVFSDAGERSIVEDEGFERLLNNSYALSAAQFGIVSAIATGNVTRTEMGVEIDYDAVPGMLYLYQPGMRGGVAPDAARAAFREFILVMSADLNRRKLRRIFIRASRSDAAIVNRLMSYRRPAQFFPPLSDRISQYPLMAVARAFVPKKQKPKVKTPNQKTVTFQSKGEYHGDALANHWPTADQGTKTGSVESAETPS